MNQKHKQIFVFGTSFLVAEGLRSVLGKTGRFLVSDLDGSLDQLTETAGNGKPDVLIVDAAALECELFDFEKLKNVSNSPVVLLLLDTITRSEFQKYSEAGIENILLKNASAQEILNAAESAVSRRKYYSSEILDMILESIEAKQPVKSEIKLTYSEKEIVRLIAGGLTTKEIATRRNISFHTVNTHRKNIFRKLKVNSASELIMKAIKAGWIDNIEYYI